VREDFRICETFTLHLTASQGQRLHRVAPLARERDGEYVTKECSVGIFRRWITLTLTYDDYMARGWESKSVEEQQSLEDLTASGAVLDAQKKSGVERAFKERQKQELELQRERILSSRTSSPVRRAALEAALADIESRLALIV
jgi:hypothetical protein